MVQQIVVYAVVAAAAGWTVWSMFLRGALKRRQAATAGKTGDCGSDCACGD